MNPFLSALATLTLGILGSSVLPVPYAFSRCGVLPGCLLAFIVAFSNAYTGTLLIRAAGHLNKRTYEGVVAGAFCNTIPSSRRHGGRAEMDTRTSRFYRSIAQLSLISLLFGTLAGDAALLADTGVLALQKLFAGGQEERKLPSWFSEDSSGRIPMLFLVLGLVLPLSLSKRMRSLENAAVAGVGLVLILGLIIVQNSITAGLPAIANGELPITSFAPGAGAQIPEAMSVLFFAFYLQPMLLPLLTELPDGREGEDLLCSALQIVTIAIAFVFYSVIGVFGAARWGLKTEGDIIVNEWLPGRLGGILDVGMAIYLSISMAPMAITMRYLLDSVVAKGEMTAYSFGRDVFFTIGGIVSATSVAIIWPEQAEKLFAITGATGVCLVSYILPLSVHFKLFLTRRRHGAVLTEQEAWLLEDASLLEGSRGSSGTLAELDGRDGSIHVSSTTAPIEVAESPGRYPHHTDISSLAPWKRPLIWAWHVGVPLAVLLLGIGTSASAIGISLSKL